MKTKPLKIGDWVTITNKDQEIQGLVVDIHKNGYVTVSWSEHFTVKGKPEDLKLRLS